MDPDPTPDPTTDPTPDPTPFFSDLKDENKKFVFFAYNLIASTAASVLKMWYFLLKILKFFDTDPGGYRKIWIRDPV
jgi:hypothetical protein